MRRSKFTDEQILAIVREGEAGRNRFLDVKARDETVDEVRGVIPLSPRIRSGARQSARLGRYGTAVQRRRRIARRN